MTRQARPRAIGEKFDVQETDPRLERRRSFGSGPDQGERTFSAKRQQAVSWAVDGTIRDAKTLAAVLLWDRLRTR